MAYIDYYKVLGVAKTATQNEIKKAYKTLARKCHPDLNPDNAEAKKRFQEINEANEVLSDPDRRKKYDQYGENWKHADQFEAAGQRQQGGFGGFESGGQYWSSGQGFSDAGSGEFSDFFESMFGGARRRGGGRSARFRGQDLAAQLHLSLRDAAQKQKQILEVNGKKIRITVPAGVADGQTIKLAGQGAPGAGGGACGDLYVTFVIAEDQRFKRMDDNLYVTETIDLYTAVLGGEKEVDTLDGKVKLKVKPETQNGEKVRLKGKGFPVYKKEGQYGDLIITWVVMIPTSLSEEQKELFRKLQSLN